MEKVPTEKKEDLKGKREELKENTVQVSKNKLEERNQERDELKENREEPKDEKEETNKRVTEEIKEKGNEEAKEEGEEKGARRSDKLEQDRDEAKGGKEENICIQWRTEELMEDMEKRNQGRTEEMKMKEEERSRQMTTEEPKQSTEEITTKNENIQEKIEGEEKEYDLNLISNRITEVEEVFHGSPSFRFYCRDILSFDSEDSITLSGFHRSSEYNILLLIDFVYLFLWIMSYNYFKLDDASVAAAERLEEIKQNNEPIEEVSESQASSKVSKN